jgi:hypothetical protein
VEQAKELNPLNPAQDLEPLKSQGSPFWPWNLARLFLVPKAFFQSRIEFDNSFWAFLAAWIAGIFHALSRMDQMLLEANLRKYGPQWKIYAPKMLASWEYYWGAILISGLIWAGILWYFGGWWYRVRLEWSGAYVPSKRLARMVYVYTYLVMALPFALYRASQAAMFATPKEAREYIAPYALYLWALFMTLPFWSCIVSYSGAKALFALRPFRAFILLLALPMIAYALMYGFVFWLLVYYSDYFLK